MFKQIIVAMAGAIAAQLTAATLDFSSDEKNHHLGPRPVAVQFAAMPVNAQDFFATPAVVSTIVPFLGSPQN
jgi:hypothetical protein